MRISITIGDETRSYESASKEWINQAFVLARKLDQLPCVRIQILDPGVAMTLMTPNCPRGTGGGGALNPMQLKIHEAWIQHHLTSFKYTGGDVIALLNVLEKRLS